MSQVQRGTLVISPTIPPMSIDRIQTYNLAQIPFVGTHFTL